LKYVQKIDSQLYKFKIQQKFVPAEIKLRHFTFRCMFSGKLFFGMVYDIAFFYQTDLRKKRKQRRKSENILGNLQL